MSGELVVQEQRALVSAADIRQQVNVIQEVMQAVMKEDTHFGKIPGTPKPSLWKPGAEVLQATFRIAVSYRAEDLSGPDNIRYRVTATGTHQTTGITMGDGMGECSSDESKYKWRKASSKGEFEHAPENRKRIQYARGSGNTEYEIQQVRAEPADLANTILKMACKRAQVAMVLNVTAASDIFTQDIEDLPEELRDGAVAGEGKGPVGPKFLDDKIFAEKKAIWREWVLSGERTKEALVKWIESKGVKLSDAQTKEIDTWKRVTPNQQVPVQSLEKTVIEGTKVEPQQPQPAAQPAQPVPQQGSADQPVSGTRSHDSIDPDDFPFN